MEDISNYNDLVALYYKTMPVHRKNILQKMEGYGLTNIFAGGARKWAHPLMSSLFVTPQSLPLPLVASGGITVEIFLSPASTLYTTAGVSYYTIDSPSWKWMALSPSPDYTVALRSAVAAGRSAYIAYSRSHVFPSNGNGSLT